MHRLPPEQCSVPRTQLPLSARHQDLRSSRRCSLGVRALKLLFVLTAICFLSGCRKKPTVAAGDEFLRWSNVGKAHMDRDEAQPALAAFQKALALNPEH